jgi:adenylyl-sulfate kinase
MNPVPRVFWFFGRSGAGKTTLALRLYQELRQQKVPVIRLDGDDLRSTVCSDLGFQPEARLENHRRIAEIARLLNGQGMNVIVSTMAPEYQHRDLATRIIGENLVWFYIHAPLEVCMSRDPKGIYKRAQAGQIKLLIDYPFDAPRVQERRNYIDTVSQDVDDCHEAILGVVKDCFKGWGNTEVEKVPDKRHSGHSRGSKTMMAS